MTQPHRQPFAPLKAALPVIWAVFTVLLLSELCPAQDSGPVDDQRLYGPRSQGDTAQYNVEAIPGVPSDTVEKYLWKTNLFDSPTGKLLRSVVFPGWGQWSNGKKWKAAGVFAVESYFFARALIWRSRSFDRLHEWEASCIDGDCDQGLFNEYSSARNNRNYFYWLTGVTVFISMFDAYADAYLISLERTRDKGDEFWGGHAFLYPEDEYRVLATIKF
ncbi:MAG: hypothetical protein Kow0074_17590 [Candidatus Zixiibacteriota bacterium]